uniref:Anoctamin transmembrane domain-containing protein n=1 Tax=Zooxanthella nutricula TaxID=1333877 RepID=A0A7S2JXD2_9DINO
MEVVYPAPGAGPSLLVVSPHTSCATDPADFVPFEVAEDAKATAADPRVDSTLGCFCRQQSRRNLAAFLAPPHVTPAERLCRQWSEALVKQYGQMIGSVLAVLVLNQVLLVIYSVFIKWERPSTVSELTQSQLWKLFLSQFVNTALVIALIHANFKDTADSFPVLKVFSIGTGDYHDFNAQWFTVVGATLVLTIILQVFTTTIPPLARSYVVAPLLARFYSRRKVTQEAMNAVYMMPPWNLSLRLAQTLNVIFCILMYSGGMPILYPVGFVYCLVAYWLDKWCLLKGSRRPPAYTEDIHDFSMHLLPWAVFLHVAVAGWVYGNQALFPSRWSSLRPIAEVVFGISESKYVEVMDAYRTDPSRSVDMEFTAARFLDFSREGAWLLLLIFLACAVYYVVYYTWLLLLRPFLRPVLILLAECAGGLCPGRCGRRIDQSEEMSQPFAEAQRVMESKGMATSYALADSEFYRRAYIALQHTHQRVHALKAAEKAELSDKSAEMIL